MAEVVGLASSLFTLASFSVKSSVRLKNTVKNLQSQPDQVPKHVRQLLQELETLSGVLETLTKTITVLAEVDFTALKIPLLQCGTACKEFESEILKYSSRSSNAQWSMRDWAKVKYNGEGIAGFRQILAEYKSTLSIGLHDASLRVTFAISKDLQDQMALIQDTNFHMDCQLRRIDESLQSVMGRFAEESDSDAMAPQLLKEEHHSAQKRVETRDRLPDNDNQSPQKSTLRIRKYYDDSSALLQRESNADLQGCRDHLSLTAAKLERNIQVLITELAKRPKASMPSEDDIANLSRLRNEYEAVYQCLDICSSVGRHSRRNNDVNVYNRRKSPTEFQDQRFLLSLNTLKDILNSIGVWLKRDSKKPIQNVHIVAPQPDNPQSEGNRLWRCLWKLYWFSVAIFFRHLDKVQDLMISTGAARVLWEPRVPPNHERLRWHCSCGKLLYGDFHKTNSQALSELACSLKVLDRNNPYHPKDTRVDVVQERHNHDISILSQSTSESCQFSSSSGSAETRDVHTSGGQSHNTSTRSHNTPYVQDQTTNLNHQAPILGARRMYFEICVNSAEHEVILNEINISSVKTDAELFDKIGQTYDSLGPGWLRKIFLKPRGVHFVYFGVRHRYQAGIYKKPEEIPPVAEVIRERYHYDECPLENPPPMPSNVFLHYLSCAQKKNWANKVPGAHEESFFLNRLPKKVHHSIFSEPTERGTHIISSNNVYGWGIHIIEGPNHVVLSLVLGFLILLCLFISLIVCGIQGTQEQGFSIGQFLVAVVGCWMGSFYFWLQDFHTL